MANLLTEAVDYVVDRVWRRHKRKPLSAKPKPDDKGEKQEQPQEPGGDQPGPGGTLADLVREGNITPQKVQDYKKQKRDQVLNKVIQKIKEKAARFQQPQPVSPVFTQDQKEQEEAKMADTILRHSDKVKQVTGLTSEELIKEILTVPKFFKFIGDKQNKKNIRVPRTRIKETTLDATGLMALGCALDLKSERTFVKIPKHNPNSSPHENDMEYLRKRRLQTEFARVISKVAEDLTGWPTVCEDLWDIDALMARRMDKRPLYHCQMSREKHSVVIIVDTSGSCSAQAQFFSEIATAALQSGDVEVYTAPNADVEARLRLTERAIMMVPINYTNNKAYSNDGRCSLMNIIRNRTIIFFGDFDGWEIIKRCAQFNKLYFFNCAEYEEDCLTYEQRENQRARWGLDRFKGKHFFPCREEADFMQLAKKVR